MGTKKIKQPKRQWKMFDNYFANNLNNMTPGYFFLFSSAVLKYFYYREKAAEKTKTIDKNVIHLAEHRETTKYSVMSVVKNS